MTIAEVELERRNRWLEELRNLKLNTLLSTILRKIKSLGVLKPPRPIKISPEQRDKNKFYDFHQEHGHTTDECLTLKGKIAMLIKNDQLLEFLENDEECKREDKGRAQVGEEIKSA